MNILCAICGDVFTGATKDECIYATQCGHIFHYHCLLEWFERSKTCPQCRHKTTEKNIFRMYFNNTNPSSESDSSFLKFRVDSLEFQVKMNEMEMKKLTEEKTKAETQNEGLRKEVKTMTQKVTSSEQSMHVIKDELKSLKLYCKQLSEAKLENEELKRKITSYNAMKHILEGSIDEADIVVENTDLDAEYLRHCVKQFKTTIKNLESEHKEMQTELLYCKGNLAAQGKDFREIKQKYEKLKQLYKSKSNENSNCNSTINNLSDKEDLETSIQNVLSNCYRSNNQNSSKLQTKRPFPSSVSILDNHQLKKNVRITAPTLHKSKSCSLIGVTQMKSQTARGPTLTSSLASSSGDDNYHPNKYILEKGTKKIKKLSACAVSGIFQKRIDDYKKT